MQPNLAEAKRRIAEVRRTRAETLDLGDLALRELPASVGDLPHLKALSLGSKKLTETGELAWEDDREVEVEDLSPLAGLQGLELLDLTGCGEVWDLSPLASLQGLRTLNLWRVDIADLSPLAGLRELQSLTLSDLAVSDLVPLAGLQKLQHLDLSDCRILKDLTPLAGLRELRSLDVSRTGVTDLSPLAGLRELQSLDLRSSCAAGSTSGGARTGREGPRSGGIVLPASRKSARCATKWEVLLPWSTPSSTSTKPAW